MTRWIVGCALVCAIGVDARARCAMQELAPAPITHGGDALPADGGILVGFTSIVQGPQVDGDPSRQPGWKVLADGKPVDVTLDTLAPGLTVYRAPAGGTPLVVNGADGKRVLAVTRDGRPSPQLKAPRPYRANVLIDGRSRIAREQLVVTLATPAPETAVAVILYAEHDQKRAAISFGMLDRDQRDAVVPYRDADRCAWNPPEMHDAKIGDSVTIAWVDRAGHVSPPSTPIKVEGVK